MDNTEQKISRFTMTVNQFAAHRGVKQPTISGYMKHGKLKGCTRRVHGQIMIDPVAADAALEGNLLTRGPSKPAKKARVAKPIDEMSKAVFGSGMEDLTYNEARTLNEQYKALLNKQQFELREKQLVSAEDVEREAANCAVAVKDSLMAITDRVSSLVAAESDERKIRDILNREFRDVLKHVSNRLCT
jgi:hypothetical protein